MELCDSGIMLTAFALLALGSTGSPQEPAEARPPLAPEPVRALELPRGEGLGIGPTHRLVVKFVDGARVRFPGAVTYTHLTLPTNREV